MSKISGWFAGLTKKGKVATIVGTSLLGLTAVGAASPQTQTTEPAPRPAAAQPATQTKATPKIETKTVEVKSVVAFSTVNKNDASLAQGTTKTVQEGVNGERTITYEVTYADGKETARTQKSDKVTKEPVDNIISVGTYVAPKPKAQSCDPNYSGACVPIASDVDCAGGSGNGPAYVSGPVYVDGTDIYGLDRDGNGVACE